MDNNRRTVYEVLYEMEANEAYSNLTLNKVIKANQPDSPAFVREAVYGITENKLLLDYYLDLLIPSGLKRVKKRETVLLRMGLYQIIFMNSVPDYAAISETVNLARKLCKGREGFINGVLRGFMKKGDALALPDEKENLMDYLSVRYSFPKDIIKLWQDQFGPEQMRELLEASNQRPPLSLRVNVARTTAESLEKALIAKGFQVTRGKYSPRTLIVTGGNANGTGSKSNVTDTAEYEQGLFSLQDEASTLAVDLLNPSQGQTVIDVCAAPGGKTAAIAEAMNNKGKVIACDIFEHKIKLIEEQASRLGLDIISTRLLDGAKGAQELAETADKVLADVPCSGLGVIRRKPEIKYRTLDRQEELLELQKAILDKASSYVKVAGELVYSTCTINKDENQRQIERFLESHKDFERLEEHEYLPMDNIDGFYACKLLRKG